jgi:long-chain fatty acid transport protein
LDQHSVRDAKDTQPLSDLKCDAASAIDRESLRQLASFSGKSVLRDEEKMKNVMIAAAAAAVSATSAHAGGFERSTTPLGFIFEKGNYAELSFGAVSPKVSGALNAAPSVTTGNVTKNYTTTGLAFKTDLSDQISLGLTLDQSFGADVAYPTGTGYPIAGSTAKLRGDTIALIGRYKFNDAMSVHGGLRSVGIGGDVSLSSSGTNFYSANFANDRDVGYLIGAAYEKPEIALRVALTYASKTKHDLVATGTVQTGEGPFGFTESTTVELPKSLTLDFQTGVAADTLVFGSIRWMDWSATTLVAPNAGGANPLVSYANDTITYNIGVGRKFSDAFSGAVSMGYEKTHGDPTGNLGPTDGLLSLQVGGTYTHQNMKITAGVRYVDIGNASALKATPTSTTGNARFSGNSAVAFGMKVGFTF